VNCPACGTPSEPGRKFCAECGARLSIVCPTCAAANAPTARFCGECGTRLSADAPAVLANRDQSDAHSRQSAAQDRQEISAGSD
jgi:predicted nucleic acid-binding Zn ribbon protein